MKNDPIGPAAEGLPTRRRFLAGLATATLALSSAGAAAAVQTATGRGEAAPLPRIVGANDRREPYASRKFAGPGWYAFWDGKRGSPKRIMWAFQDDHPFIALSDGYGAPVEVYVSHRAFDRACWGICRTVPAGREVAI